MLSSLKKNNFVVQNRDAFFKNIKKIVTISTEIESAEKKEKDSCNIESTA